MTTLSRKISHIAVAVMTMATLVAGIPQSVSSASAEGSFNSYKAVSAGYNHSCGITGTDVVRCWGYTEPVPSDLGLVSQISAGFGQTCAIKKPSSEVACWSNRNGEYFWVPTNLGAVLEISVGFYHQCVVTVEQEAKCWGDEEYGRTIVPPDLGKISQISTGDYSTCAVTIEGNPRCWGYPRTDVPAGTGKVKQLSLGSFHVCAISLTDNALCWGSSAWGETIVPNSLGKVSQIESGDSFTCAKKLTESAVVCWGEYSTPTLAIVPASVSAGDEHACAVSSSGEVQCWGNSSWGKTDLPPNISIPEAPTINVSFGNLSQLMVYVVHDWSASDGTLVWKVLSESTEVCRIKLSGSCIVSSVVPARNYTYTVIGSNESGQTRPVSKTFRFCPTQIPKIDMPSDYLTKANQKLTFSGKIFTANLCTPLPKFIEYRKKVYGKAWTSWKTFKISSKGGFGFSDTFEFNSKIEIRTKLSGSIYTTKSISIPVQINYALPLRFYTKASKIKNGYTQGGEITVKFGGDKAFNGTCVVSGKTDYAFNFALVPTGKESRFTVFKVKNGIGSGKLSMRWNGKVSVGALCEDPRFVSILDYRTPTFRANF